MLIPKARSLFMLLIVLQTLMFSEILHAGDELILAVHPYLPAAELVKRFDPLVKYLSGELGQPVTLQICKDYKAHIELVGRNGADIMYVGPASYVSITEKYGRKPILARLEIKGKPVFRGAIIVRSESKINDLTDLVGKRFAFGDPASTMSHLVPRYMLIDKGVEISELAGYEHLKTHNNVALSVLAGDFDVGAVKEEVFFKYQKRGLRVLAWTPSISEHVLVVSDTLSTKKTDLLRSALYSLKNTEEGKKILREIKKTMTAMVPAKDEDYDNLRNILRVLEGKGILR